jgi:hypothetical protein
MNSFEYRRIIRTISFNLLKKRFPGLDKQHMQEVARLIAVNIHARMYGANVDNVDSPIWNNNCDNDKPQPKIDAKDLLNEENSSS